MRYIKKFIAHILCVALLFSCTGNKTQSPTPSGASSQALTNSPGTNSDSFTKPAQDKALQQDNAITSQQILDTNKIKSDLNSVSDFLKGKPDTNKLKNAAADILSADAAILSDSGISKMYGNNNDPAVNEAKNALIKMRNSMGITPGRLDSMKKSAAILSSESKPK